MLRYIIHDKDGEMLYTWTDPDTVAALNFVLEMIMQYVPANGSIEVFRES